MEVDTVTSYDLLTLIAFCLSSFFVIVPTRIPLSFLQSKRGEVVDFTLDFSWSPLFGVIILLTSNCITIDDIWRGIIGDETLQPYSILILFLSLSYISISIDATGLFSFIANYFTKRIGGSGKTFYFFIFFLSSILTIFTSNDIVIMTLTPIISHIANQSKINPIAFLIIQFFSANIWSAALYIGNPTNVIVAQSVHMNFFEYSLWNFLPTFFAGITMFMLTTFFTFSKIPIVIPGDIATAAKLDRFSAALSTFLMVLSLISIIVFTFLPQYPIFIATLPFAIIVLLKDVLHDLFFNEYNRKRKTGNEQSAEPPKNAENPEENVNPESTKNEAEEEQQERPEIQERAENIVVAPVDDTENLPISRFHWRTKQILEKMPWKIIPFVLGMFILVEALNIAGWISVFARFFGSVVGDNIFVAALFVGVTSALACNVMNNQPMTILFVQIILNSNYSSNPTIISVSLFAVALGSNFGANLTLIGALAGILWSEILSYNNQKVSYFLFAFYGFRIMPLVIFIALLTLALEFFIFYSRTL